MEFSLLHSDGSARAGKIETDHGIIDTPVFMPVGTIATVKAIDPRALLDEAQSQIILGNTYHLHLRPGMEIMREAGGLQQFMGWPRPILTDSGGYQIFSLASRCKVTDHGATFQSHIDGSRHLFTPESVIDTQRTLGSDIMMVLDECPAAGVSEEIAADAASRTVAWAERALRHWQSNAPLYGHSQALFAIVQGGTFAPLRLECAQALVGMDFPGYAIGGLSVGEPPSEMYRITEIVARVLPQQKPRYLMGVGTPTDLLECIGRGVDMFDCVLPTRNGRNGMIFTTEGIINIRNQRWAKDFTPLDQGLQSYYSRTFTKAYLRHLFVAKEILGLKIASLQNLCFYQWLMQGARTAIIEKRYAEFKGDLLPRVSRRL